MCHFYNTKEQSSYLEKYESFNTFIRNKYNTMVINSDYIYFRIHHIQDIRIRRHLHGRGIWILSIYTAPMNLETDVCMATKHFVYALGEKCWFKFHTKCELDQQQGGATSRSSSLLSFTKRPRRFGVGEHKEQIQGCPVILWRNVQKRKENSFHTMPNSLPEK